MMADEHYHLPLSRRHDKRAKKGGTRHTLKNRQDNLI